MLPQIALDRHAGAPLHEQLAGRLRQLVLLGELRPGARLPPTRHLARTLGVSRNVVVRAYELLQLEGYLQALVGSGTRVPESLPGHLLGPDVNGPSVSIGARPRRGRLSRGGELLSQAGANLLPHQVPPRPFRPGAIDRALFPSRRWGRIAGRLWRSTAHDLLRYGDPAGYQPLREAIADHVTRNRAVRCDASRIIITHGSQQALDLVGRLLLDPGDDAAVEDPGYPAARAAFRGAGARLLPLEVDADGMQPPGGAADRGTVRICYTTPSHQYPLGVTMSLERRLRLLDWAHHRDVWIVEDDYDSEFRFASRPLPSLQGLDQHGRVIYIGTFSKVLAPGLRLGYLIVPDALVESFVRARTAVDYHPQLSLQAELAEFMAEGHLDRHVATLRAVYGERWELLGSGLRALPAEWVKSVSGAAGLHLTAMLGDGFEDRRVSERALRAGIEAPALSSYALEPNRWNGLVLGFGAAPPEALRSALGVLRRVLGREVAEQ